MLLRLYFIIAQYFKTTVVTNPHRKRPYILWNIMDNKMRTLHLISHTHWDREWYLPYQQFRLKLVRLVDNLLDILDQDSSYRHFMLDGQTIVLEDYLQIRPEREGDLRRFIQEGRILIGPWYILPDEFLVSPEATIRNLLEGERTAKAFGPKMMVGYIPDPFGHIGQMPQILRGFGIETASVMRGLSDEPCELWWQSPDGSRVLMAYLRESYGNAAGILNGGVEHFAAEAHRLGSVLAPNAAAPHLLLMHGVDHMEAHPDTSAAVAAAETAAGEGRLEGFRLVHSTLPDYFSALRASLDLNRLPVVTGELRSPRRHPLLPAVLSTRMWIKQRNHACETLLEKWAEPFSAWAAQAAGARLPESGLKNPAPVLRQAWRLLIQCHPHDSICGCSIDPVHEEMRSRFDQVAQMAEAVTAQSLEALTTAVDTSSPAGALAESALVVYNPAIGPRTDLVSVEVEAQDSGGELELLDQNGAAVPFQSQGLGSRDLITMTMKRTEFHSAFLSTSDGEVMGLRMMELGSRREGSRVQLEIVLSEKGEPNRALLLEGRQRIEAYLRDPAITEYHIHARSVSSSRLLFSAPDVPGHGYRAFYIRSRPAQKQEPLRLSPLARAVMPVAARVAASPLARKVLAQVQPVIEKRQPREIENEYFIVVVEPSGTLKVADKRTGVQYSGLNRFVDGGDRGDEYNYSPPAADRLVNARLKEVRVERGAVVQSIELALEMQVPEALSPDRAARGQKLVTLPIRTRVTLTSGVPRVDIHSQVDNRARDHRLRVHFPAPFTVQDAEYDGHFEVACRPLDLPPFDSTWVEQPRPEVPMRAFTAVRSAQSGLLLAARGLPEVEVLRQPGGNAEIALTLLRCVGWLSRDDFPERAGHAGPFLATPGAQEQGQWSFDYALVPFASGDFLAAYQQGYAFQTPLRAVGARLHAGSLPPMGSFVQSSAPEFVLSAVKTAEDGRGWLARGYNLSGGAVDVALRSLLPFQSAARVNLAEEFLSELPSDGDQQVRFTARPHEVVTVRFIG
jgi:mannosylglycerate hydrolase